MHGNHRNQIQINGWINATSAVGNWLFAFGSFGVYDTLLEINPTHNCNVACYFHLFGLRLAGIASMANC
jgi:hypothetical protein